MYGMLTLCNLFRRAYFITSNETLEKIDTGHTGCDRGKYLQLKKKSTIIINKLITHLDKKAVEIAIITNICNLFVCNAQFSISCLLPRS